MNKLNLELMFYAGFNAGTSLVMLMLTECLEVVPVAIYYTWSASLILSCIMIVARTFYVEYKEKKL